MVRLRRTVSDYVLIVADCLVAVKISTSGRKSLPSQAPVHC